MPQTLQEFTDPTLGKKLWNVRQQLTTMVKFEIGAKVEDDRGEYHYWLSCCHWWLKQGKGKEFEDIVNSHSSRNDIAQKIAILEGKKLLNINFDPERATTFFDFEDDLFLEVSPYGGDREVLEQWFLFKQKEILEVRSDGTYCIKDLDEKESPSSHQIKQQSLPEKTQDEQTRLKELLEDYVKVSAIRNDRQHYSETEGKKLFSFILSEYQNGHISVDDLASLCEQMYAKFDSHSQTYSHLKNGAEIAWNIRNRPISAGYSISEMLEFFK